MSKQASAIPDNSDCVTHSRKGKFICDCAECRLMLATMDRINGALKCPRCGTTNPDISKG